MADRTLTEELHGLASAVLTIIQERDRLQLAAQAGAEELRKTFQELDALRQEREEVVAVLQEAAPGSYRSLAGHVRIALQDRDEEIKHLRGRIAHHRGA